MKIMSEMKPMERVKIVTDSTADIPPALAHALDIEIVPIYVHVGSESYQADVEITNDQLYRVIQEKGSNPTTLAPTTAVFEQTYRRLAQTSDAIVSIHLSSHLSSTCRAAQQARERLPVSLARIDVVDSHSASVGLGLTVLAAAQMAHAGVPVAEIVRDVQYRVQHTHAVFFVDSIEHLERSGRVHGPTGALGSMSRIKPLLLLDDGHIVLYERTRTRAKAIDGLFTFVEDFPNVHEIAVTHSTTPEDVEKLLDKLTLIFPRDQVLVAPYGTAIGTHLGPGALGVAVYEG
jgi:DegV family protein with EDD domain